MSKETWLIIEPTFVGHHYTYLENIIEQAFLYDIDVIIATQNDINGDLITKNILNKFSDPPIILCFGKMPVLVGNISFFKLFVHQIKVRAYYKSVYNKVIMNYTINNVFIPYLDDFIYSLSFLGSPFGSTTFSGISMRQIFHFSKSLDSIFGLLILRFKKFLFFNLVRNKLLKYIFIIDPILKQYIDSFKKIYSHKVLYFADPVNHLKLLSKSVSREQLSIPIDNLVILVFGYLDQRKGIDFLLKWANENSTISPITILLIGSQSNEVKNMLNSINYNSQLNIIIKDEFVAECLEGLFFSAADIVWIAYPNFLLMSSVLVKAAQAETNILYYDYGLISFFANNYGSPLHENSFFMKKGFILNNGLNIKSFKCSNNSFILDHSWKNAGNIFFNS